MPRLRMKSSTNSATEEAVLKASRRASRKSKRHKPSTTTRPESISPPRHRTSHMMSDFDESSVPPEQAYKRTRSDEESEQEAEIEFQEKLREASYSDQGIGYYEEAYYSTSYTTAAGNATGIGKPLGPTAVGGMDEEEYAEYIRAGIWRLQNKERLEYLERQEKLRKEQAEKDRLDKIERERKERLKRKKLEQRRKDQLNQDRDQARERYRLGWNKLHSLSSAASATAATNGNPASQNGTGGGVTLRFTDFVWPIFPPFALPPISWPHVDELDSNSIEEFLFPPGQLTDDERKSRLRTAVLSYHPDRFERLVQLIQDEKKSQEVVTDNAAADSNADETDVDTGGVRERVRELGLRVSQVLNDLLKEGKKK